MGTLAAFDAAGCIHGTLALVISLQQTPQAVPAGSSMHACMQATQRPGLCSAAVCHCRSSSAAGTTRSRPCAAACRAAGVLRATPGAAPGWWRPTRLRHCSGPWTTTWYAPTPHTRNTLCTLRTQAAPHMCREAAGRGVGWAAAFAVSACTHAWLRSGLAPACYTVHLTGLLPPPRRACSPPTCACAGLSRCQTWCATCWARQTGTPMTATCTSALHSWSSHQVS